MANFPRHLPPKWLQLAENNVYFSMHILRDDIIACVILFHVMLRYFHGVHYKDLLMAVMLIYGFTLFCGNFERQSPG